MIQNKKLNILVTGATGYIGSHLCKILKENLSCHLTILSNTRHFLYNCKENRHPYFNTAHFDVDVREFASDLEFDVVVHLAGLISVEESTRIPDLYYDVNVNGTANILKIKTDHFIFASTAGAFNPTSEYANTKIKAENLIKDLSKNYTIFRFFNVAGSNSKYGQIGPSTHLIRILSEVATNKRCNFSIYGNDYNTYDGTCVRDYIHVDDICCSILKSIINGPKNTPYECLGRGIGYSNKEVVEEFQKSTQTNFKYDITDRRPGDPDRLVVDNLSDLSCTRYTLADMCQSAYLYESSL